MSTENKKPQTGRQGVGENKKKLIINTNKSDSKSQYNDDISTFQGAINKRPVATATWQKALEDIRSDKYRKVIENVRVVLHKFGSDSNEYREIKKKLPSVTFGGTFSPHRAKTNISSPTGIIIPDLDHLDERTEIIFRLLTQDKNVWFIFRSPSGEGLKVGIRAQGIKNDDDHKKLYFAVEQCFKDLYGITIDPACKDISRLTFVSYDPKLWINPEPQYFDISAWSKPLPLPPQLVKPGFTHIAGKEKYAHKALESRCEEIRQSQPRKQHYTRLRAARLMGGFLHYIDEAEVLSALEQAVIASGAKDVRASMKTIRDGIAYGKLAPITIEDLHRSSAAHSESNSPGQIEHLASLAPFLYEQQRVSMADKLGVRVSILDQEVEKIRRANSPDKAKSLVEELEPWPEPVSGTELLDTIYQTVKDYMIIPDESATVCALWTVLSYAYNNFVCVPILAVQSPVKRCGKSRLITGVLNALCYRALSASNVTGPTVFRVIEKYHPCLVLDEHDTYMPDDECLRGILNSGHTRQTAFVLRCNINTLEPECFSTWCPKIIGGIGRLPDTLQDRAVAIDLKRKLATETTKRLTLKFNDECLNLRRKCIRWCQDHEHELQHANPQLPGIDNDRALDNWTPLLAIADLIGSSWQEKARGAMVKFEGQKDDDNIRIILLQDIKKVFDERGCQRLWTQNLIEALTSVEDRPWCEWKKGKPITPVGLAKMLKPFEIASFQIRQGDKNKFGYRLEQFKDVFDRYISSPLLPIQNTTTLQPNNHAGFEGYQNTTKGINVVDRNSLKPASIAKCSGVVFQKGGTGEEDIKESDQVPEPLPEDDQDQEVIPLW